VALVPATLSSGFLQLAKYNPPSARLAARQFAAIYTSYAKTGNGGAGFVTLLPPVGTRHPEQIRLENAIYTAVAVPATGTPPTAAAAWVTGLTSFWLTPPVAITGAQSGVVAAFLGAPALLAALTALFSNPLNTPTIFANSMANALHAATLTVGGLVAPPPATPFTLL
jgi:hypothetical protein